MRGGATIDAVLAEHAHQAAVLGPLLAAAEHVAEDIVSPPPSDLATVRDRLLAAAAQKRETAPGKRGVGAQLASWFAPGRPLSLPRLVTAAVAVLVFMFVGGPLAGRVAADALPGEPLYSVKRINERIALALLFDPEARDEREIQYSQRRAGELLALASEGREATIESWKVRFREFVDQSRPNERRPYGWLLVVPLVEEGKPETIRLQLDPDTKVDFLGRYGSWDELPPGSRLVIHVETQQLGPIVVLGVVLDEEPASETTPTPDAQTTPDGTSGPAQTASPETPGTPTAGATGTLSVTVTTEPLTPTTETTETPESTATPTRGVNVSRGKPSARDRYALQGYVTTIIDDATWIVVEQASDRSADRKAPEVTVDVSAITADRRSGVTKGAWVRLMGRWIDDAMTRYEATSLDSYEAVEDSPAPAGRRCRGANSVIGRVAEHVPLSSVTLVDGSSYDLTEISPEAQPRDLEVGARVEIDYQLCENGRRKATSITVLDARPQVRPYRGTIAEASADRFTLVSRDDTRYVVLYDTSTAIIGAAGLARGQSVQVRGWSDDEGQIHAVEVRVAESASPPPEEATATRVIPPTSVPSATAELPAPSLTPILDSAATPSGAPIPPNLQPAEPPAAADGVP
jgi:hypothetical protein